MLIIYVVYFLLFCVSYFIIKTRLLLLLSPELRQIPTLPLIQTIRWNKGYLTGEPYLHMIRNHLMESLNKKGIIKIYDIIIGKWMIFISKPELIKEGFLRSDVFQKWDQKLPKPESELKFLGLNNILFEIKESHFRHRRVSSPAFSHSWPSELFGKLAIELFEEMDKSCEKNPSFDVFHLAKAYTLDVLGLAAFDYNFGLIRNSGNKLEEAYDTAIRGMSDAKYYLFPFLEKTPGFKRPEIMNQLDYLNDIILDIIKKRRQLLKVNNNDDYDGPRDLLYFMLKAEESQDNKSRLTTEELLNDMKIFLIAGHDTTAIAVSAAIYFLGMNQECQEKAREEAIRILGDEKKDVIPTPEQIKELKYINMIIQETLRFHPPAPVPSFREAQKDTKLGEYVIKKGTIVSLNIYSSHHAEDTWEDPYKFKPERFANEKGATSRYFPFGGGNRICIGMNLSFAEQKVFLAMIVRKYSWNIIEPNLHKNKIEVLPALFGLSVPNNLHVNFERRY